MSADLMIAAGVVLGTVLFGWAVFGAVLGMEWLCVKGAEALARLKVKFGYRALRYLSLKPGYRPLGCLSLKPGYRALRYLSRGERPGQTQAGRGEG